MSLIPHADATDALAVPSLSLHRWPDPAAGLAEITRVLRPGRRRRMRDLLITGWLSRLVVDSSASDVVRPR